MSAERSTFMEIVGLSKLIAESWKFNSKNYPELPSDIPQRQLFCLRHVALHQAKATANIVAAIEPMDHGEPLNRALLAKGIRNSIVNALMLAEQAGILPSEIETMIRGWGIEHHQL